MGTQELLEESKLRYSNDKKPGITRKKNGESFLYFSSEGDKITDEKTLERIKNLHIPPAWENVWICPSPKGHLQAVGYDNKKRKQYRYHEEWIKAAQQNKFESLLLFAEVLPKLRRHINEDMALPGVPRKKVIATIVWLLENTLIRIGNEEYREENDTLGLTTLGNKNVDIRKNILKFEFKGKSGVYHSIRVQSKRVAKIIKKCQNLPGQDLFQYVDEDGLIESVDSDDVNNYLKDITGLEITAKEFRTWGGTVSAAEFLSELGILTDEKELKKAMTDVVKKVAKDLGNKPATSRKYYIHPYIFEAFTNGQTVSNLKIKVDPDKKAYNQLNELEKKVCYLLMNAS
jgi:DNA topoisomerase-1